MSASESDTVGYKKPPRHSQFRKGQSGNPAGRPRPVTSASAALATVLTRLVTVSGEGGEVRVTRMEALFRKLVDNAMTGDLRSLKLVFDRLKHLEDRPFYSDLLKELCLEADQQAQEPLASQPEG